MSFSKNTAFASAAAPKALVAKGKPTIIHRALTNYKILASSPAHGQGKIQAAIDKDLAEYQRSEKAKLPKWGTQIEPADGSTMSSDFSDMGYSSEEAQELKARQEPLKVDGLTQRFVAGGSHVAGTGLPIEKKKKVAPRAKKGYTDLLVYEDKNWILFDPLKPHPEQVGTPPAAVTRWSTYVTGNPRVVLQNKKTKSLRTQATPVDMLQKTVDYTDLGPRIANWSPIRDPSKPKAIRPEPGPEPEPETNDAPLLGRGARRDAKRKVFSDDQFAPPPAKESKKRKADATSAIAEDAGSSTGQPEAAPAASRKKRKTPARVENSSSE